MILLQISRVALLNQLWEFNPDRSMFSLIIELKDLVYMKAKVQLADAENANIFILNLQRF